MKTLKVIIIDDEKEACELLESYAKSLSPENLELLGRAHTVESGAQLIEATQPDLVFLDVKLSPGSGFDILNHFEHIDFQVIFTTAHQEYAVKAIRFAAIDFLLKPIDIHEFEAAISRAREKIATDTQNGRMEVFKEILSNSKASFSRIVLPTIDGFIIEKTDEILFCKADGNYTHFHLRNGQKMVVSKTLKTFESILRDQGFFRGHISYLINIEQIKSFKRHKKGGAIFLNDGTEIPLSESRKKEFMQIFDE